MILGLDIVHLVAVMCWVIIEFPMGSLELSLSASVPGFNKVANHVISMIGFTDFRNQCSDNTGKDGQSFISFIIIIQISCGKVQIPRHVFDTRLYRKSPGFAAVFQIASINCRKNVKILCDRVHTILDKSLKIDIFLFYS